MRELLKSRFLRSVSILMSGSIIGQLLSIIVSPIMTRLYSPEAIGEYTLILTSVGLFGGIMCLKYDSVIVYERKDENVVPLMVLSFVITLVLSMIISFILLIYYITTADFMYALYVGLSVFILLLLTGTGNILGAYNNRCQDYKLLTIVTIIRSIAKEVPIVLFGILSPSSYILVGSNILSLFCGIGKQSKRFRINYKISCIKKSFSLSSIISIAREYKKQSLFTSPALLVNNFSYSSINFFIKALYGATCLGFYSISYRLLGLPLSLIATSISRVFLKEASSKYNSTGSYRGVFLKTSFFLLLIALPMVLMMITLAPTICSLFFGKDYYVAGIYARYLAPLFGFRLIVGSLTSGLQISGKQNIELSIQVIFAICAVLLYALADLNSFSIDKYLIMICCSFSAIYVIFWFILYFNSYTTDNKLN